MSRHLRHPYNGVWNPWEELRQEKEEIYKEICLYMTNEQKI